MRWINFVDGTVYTFASDIQNFAEANGYVVPCEPDGTRHPGTDCNAKMRTIVKDAGMRRTFGITEQSVVDIHTKETFDNQCFEQWLVDYGLVRFYPSKQMVQLYSPSAVNALLSVMLKTHVEYEFDSTDEEWDCPYIVRKINHNFEKKKNRPKASLFNK